MATTTAYMHAQQNNQDPQTSHSHSLGHDAARIRKSSYSGSASSSTLIVTPLSFKMRERSASPIFAATILAPPPPASAANAAGDHTPAQSIPNQSNDPAPNFTPAATASTMPTIPGTDIASKGHLEPHVSNLPRRRRTLKSSGTGGAGSNAASGLGQGGGIGLGLTLNLTRNERLGDDLEKEKDSFLLPSPIALPQLPDLLMGMRVEGDDRGDSHKEEESQQMGVATPNFGFGSQSQIPEIKKEDEASTAQFVQVPPAPAMDRLSASPSPSPSPLSQIQFGGRRSGSPGKAPARKGFSFTLPVPESAPASMTNMNLGVPPLRFNMPPAPASAPTHAPGFGPIPSPTSQPQSQPPAHMHNPRTRQIPRYLPFYHTPAQMEQARASGRRFPPFVLAQPAFRLVPGGGDLGPVAGSHPGSGAVTGKADAAGASFGEGARSGGGESGSGDAAKADADMAIAPPLVPPPPPAVVATAAPSIRRNFASHALSNFVSHPPSSNTNTFGSIPSNLKNLPRRRRGRRYQLQQLAQQPMTEEDVKRERRRMWERRWMVQEVGRKSGVFVGYVEVGDGSYWDVRRGGGAGVKGDEKGKGKEKEKEDVIMGEIEGDANANGEACNNVDAGVQVPRCNWGMDEWDEDKLEESLPDFGGWKRVVVVNTWLGVEPRDALASDGKGRADEDIASSSIGSMRINRSGPTESDSDSDIKSIDLIIDKHHPHFLERNDHGITSLTEEQIRGVARVVKRLRRSGDTANEGMRVGEGDVGEGDGDEKVAVLVLARSRLCLVDAISLAGYLIVDIHKTGDSKPSSATASTVGYALPPPVVPPPTSSSSGGYTIPEFPDDAQNGYHEIHSLFMHLHNFGFSTTTRSYTPPYSSNGYSPLSFYARTNASGYGGGGGSGEGGSLGGGVPLISNNGNGFRLGRADAGAGDAGAVDQSQYAVYPFHNGMDDIDYEAEGDLDTDAEDESVGLVPALGSAQQESVHAHEHERGLRGVWRGLVSRDGMDYLVEVMETA